MTIKIYSMRNDFGADIEGLQIATGVSTKEHAQVEDALTRYAFLCFPNQDIDDTQQLAFSKQFGDLYFEPDVSRRRLEDGHFQDVSNIDNDNKGLLAKKAERRMYSNANLLWHIDLPFVRNTACVTVLSARQLPHDPPDTQYADMRSVDTISTANPLIESGPVNALAVTTAERSPVLPNVRSLRELGVKNTDVGIWLSISAPASTPYEIVQRINQTFNQLLNKPGSQLQAWLAATGWINGGGPSANFKRGIEKESVEWGSLIRVAGIKLQ